MEHIADSIEKRLNHLSERSAFDFTNFNRNHYITVPQMRVSLIRCRNIAAQPHNPQRRIIACSVYIIDYMQPKEQLYYNLWLRICKEKNFIVGAVIFRVFILRILKNVCSVGDAHRASR